MLADTEFWPRLWSCRRRASALSRSCRQTVKTRHLGVLATFAVVLPHCDTPNRVVTNDSSRVVHDLTDEHCPPKHPSFTAKSSPVSQMWAPTSEPIYSMQVHLGILKIPVTTNGCRKDRPRYIEHSQCAVLAGPNFGHATALRRLCIAEPKTRHRNMTENGQPK